MRSKCYFWLRGGAGGICYSQIINSQEKDENSIVKQSLKISVDLYHSGQNSFYSSLKKMTDYCDFPGFNCNLLNKCKIKQYVDLMQKKYISYWKSHPSTFTKT